MEERQMGAHQYLHLVKKKSNVEFQDKVAHYADLYQLPPRPDNYPWPEFMEDSFTKDQVQTKEKRPANDSVWRNIRFAVALGTLQKKSRLILRDSSFLGGSGA